MAIQMSKEERNRLLGQIALYESQVSSMRTEVHSKTEKINKLKKEGPNNGHLPAEFNEPDDLTNAHVGQFSLAQI
jgi:hypothetical protein